MAKLLLFTDIHITEAGQTIIGLDPLDRFERALKRAVTDHPDASGILISGDLTHRGLNPEYLRLKACLDQAPLPVFLMLGNHDNREEACKVFPQMVQNGLNFVQFRLDFGHHTILCLDTKDDAAPDHHSGYLCAERLTWLDHQLKDAKGQIITVVAHHPPHDVGFPGMDAIKIRNGRALLARGLKYHQLICGHVHRTIMGSLDGLPFAMLKSTCHQAPLDFEDQTTSSSIDEPAAYGVLCLNKKSVVIHTEDVSVSEPTRHKDDHSQS